MPPTEKKRYTVTDFEFPPPDYPAAIGAAYSNLVRINDGYADEKSFICIDEGFRAAIRYMEEKLTTHNSTMPKLHRAVCGHCYGSKKMCDNCYSGSRFYPLCRADEVALA